MIIYQSTKSQFLDDNDNRNIEDVVSAAYLMKTGRYAPTGEFNAWKSSLYQMAKVLRDSEIPDDSGIGIEYGIPQTAKRIDFVISGTGEDGFPNLVIVELKQWSSATLSEKDGIIVANRGGRSISEGTHPSYQAWSYAALLKGFNEAIHENETDLHPCAYLHNYREDSVIKNEHYAAYIEKAPVFLHGETEIRRLREFIKRHVKMGDNAQLLYRIEEGRIRPSKMLADSMVKMLKGNQEFVLVDDQKIVYETCLAQAAHATEEKKEIIIIKGGPGTGKSVVAINLLVALTKRGSLVQYVSKNAAPRAVYAHKLAGNVRKVEISSMFSGSGRFYETSGSTFDTLIVDEAHRLNEKSGLYGNLGENQIKEIINSAKCSIFFSDDDQIVTLSDIGHTDELRRWASEFNANVTILDLKSQFRCGGADGYIAWLDNILGIRETANESFDADAFDFQIFDSPVDLHEAIREKNAANNKSRVVAGYCWDWKSKKDPKAFDITIPEHGFRAQWNLGSDGSLWIVAEESIEQVGCIHTCQGLELDYVGVMVGPDLCIRDNSLGTNADRRSKHDRSIRGYKSKSKSDDQIARKVDKIIRNTYKTLMTRGMKGCYVYFTDAKVAEHFRIRLLKK